MKRRSFLKSIGATALLPAIPVPASALVVPGAAQAASAGAYSAHTYQWAEMIVRAHNKCNLGLLQRSLHIDAKAAAALKESLIRNGIVTAKANAYGIHTATKPLYEGAFINVSEAVERTAEAIEKIPRSPHEEVVQKTNPLEQSVQNSHENESKFKDLDEERDSGVKAEEISSYDEAEDGLDQSDFTPTLEKADTNKD